MNWSGKTRARSMFESASATWPKRRHLRRPARAAVVAASVASLFATTTALAAASDLPAPAARVVDGAFHQVGINVGPQVPAPSQSAGGDSGASRCRPLRQYGGDRASGSGAPVGASGRPSATRGRFGEQRCRPGPYRRFRSVRNHPGGQGPPPRSPSREHRVGEVPEAGPAGRGRRSPGRTQDRLVRPTPTGPGSGNRGGNQGTGRGRAATGAATRARVGEGRQPGREPRRQPGHGVGEGEDREEGQGNGHGSKRHRRRHGSAVQVNGPNAGTSQDGAPADR